MSQGQGHKFVSSVLVVGCFACLAWLNGRELFGQDLEALAFAGVGLLLLLLCLLLTTGLNRPADASAPRPWTFGAVWGAVVRGFLIMVPFTLLALLAELVFHWQAAQSFIQASLMTSGAAAGAELMRQAGPKTRYLIVSMIVAFVFCMAWTGLVYYIPWDLVQEIQ